MQADSFSLQPHLLSPKKATVSLQGMLNANFGDRAVGATVSFQAVFFFFSRTFLRLRR